MNKSVFNQLALSFLVLPALLFNGPAQAASDREQAAICAKAEQRYEMLYGKPSAKEEGVVIVKMYNYTFCPPQVTVKQGTTVRWVNVDKRTSHSVWFKQEGKEESARIFPDLGDKTEMKFDLPPGDYPYLCGPHWESDDMKGTVTVKP